MIEGWFFNDHVIQKNEEANSSVAKMNHCQIEVSNKKEQMNELAVHLETKPITFTVMVTVLLVNLY